MTKITKIKLRKIEVQKRLREIAGLENDQLTQQIRNEAAALSTEHSGLDVRLSALLITENDEVVEVDSESRELSRLSSRVECRRYLQAASFEGKLSGAELELNQHRKIGEQHMPWDALTPFPPEQRADVVTSAPTNVQQKSAVYFRANICPDSCELFGRGISNGANWRKYISRFKFRV